MAGDEFDGRAKKQILSVFFFFFHLAQEKEQVRRGSQQQHALRKKIEGKFIEEDDVPNTPKIPHIKIKQEQKKEKCNGR